RLEAKSSNISQIIDSVYVGEVWLAGGQSNMAWQLAKDLNGKQAVNEATNTKIKLLMVPQIYYEGHKVKNNSLKWKNATGDDVGEMSAVAYYFAKELQGNLGVPVGIVCCYKGGTAAEVWMSKESLEKNADFKPILIRYDSILSSYGENGYQEAYDVYTKELREYRNAVKANDATAKRPTEPMGSYSYKRPVGLYESMLKKIIPYTFRGTIWYQGEANASRAEQYQKLFPALIKLWRDDFKNPKMPFLFVQLSNYDHPNYGQNPNWAELREAQLKTWDNVSHTAMAVSIDVGNKNDIHPIEKQPVGERLAAAALATVYGSKIEYSGPVYKKFTIKENYILLDFNHVGNGLAIKNGSELKGFFICGDDKQFTPAQAEIVGNQIKVWADNIQKPTAVRYGWANYTDANLFNKNGFPATPFRTDNFDLITKGKK
ncbi:MAG: sialate O-acetylesterase, partial [Prevotellaceae bacterium]|nr:sialate O-acetylesterase [Prevotellaceae bacterium]